MKIDDQTFLTWAKGEYEEGVILLFEEMRKKDSSTDSYSLLQNALRQFYNVDSVLSELGQRPFTSKLVISYT